MTQKLQPSGPHLGRAVQPHTVQLPLGFQDDFLQVMQLSTGSDGSVHLVPGPGQGRGDSSQEGARSREDGGDRREGGKDNDWPRTRAGVSGKAEAPPVRGVMLRTAPAPPLAQAVLTSSTILLPWGTMCRKLWTTWSCSMGRGLVFAGPALTDGAGAPS